MRGISTVTWGILWFAVLVCMVIMIAPWHAETAVRPKYGGTLRLVLDTEPHTLDPVNARYPEELFILMNTTNRLVYSQGDQIIPDLARECSPSPDGKKWTIELDRGIQFQTGHPCNAADVTRSLERLRKSLYAWVMEDVVSIEATSRTSLNIYLNEPDWAFNSLLTLIPAAIVMPPAPAREMYPVATGPFQVSHWYPTQRIVLSENENYFKGAPYLEQVSIEFQPDVDNHDSEYQLGKLDLFFLPLSKLPKSSPEFLVQNVTDVIRRFSTAFIGINPRSHVLRNLDFRKNLAAAIDKNSILATMLKQEGTIASGLIPGDYLADSNLHDRTYRENNAGGIPDTSFSERITLEMIVPSSPRILAQIAERIKVNLMDTGILLRTFALDKNTYRRKLEEGNYDLCYQLWVPPTRDPYGALTSFLFSSHVMKHFYESNPGIQTFFKTEKKKISAISDSDIRKLETRALQKKLLQHAVIVPLYHENLRYVHKKQFRQLAIDPRGFFILGDVWISLKTPSNTIPLPPLTVPDSYMNTGEE